MNNRYYFWTFNESYGWRQFGSNDSYESIEEAKRDNQFHFENKNKDNLKILEAKSLWDKGYEEDYQMYLESMKEVNNEPLDRDEFLMLDREKHGN